MVRPLHVVARNTKLHNRYNILISSDNDVVLLVQDIMAFTVRVESAHQICANNIHFIMYHVLKRVLEVTCSNCQMRFTPGERTIKSCWDFLHKIVSLMFALILYFPWRGGDVI
jgi:hypothetical protein